MKTSIKTTLREIVFQAHLLFKCKEFLSSDRAAAEQLICECHGRNVADDIVHSVHLRMVAMGGIEKGRFGQKKGGLRKNGVLQRIEGVYS